MFEYKQASFYTSYFNNLPGFKVIEEFKKSEDEKEKNLYIGMIEVLNTIYPLIIRVEIPETFPHMKLTFRTKSIGGYPHLIHTGAIENGDWFCLNTPFAETAEGQLEQEVLRLKEWIEHQLRKDLPAFITDPDVIKALLFANAYDWENPDEMNEFSSKAVLTFVGEYFQNPDNFKERIGHIHCIKTHDNRYYAIREKSFSNFELPYIIVDELPESTDKLSDFVALKKQYGWDDSICKHLMPNIQTQEWIKDNTWLPGMNATYSEEEALSIIQTTRQELSKDESYLTGLITSSYGANMESAHPLLLLPPQKPLIAKILDELEKEIKEKHGYKLDWKGIPDTEEDAQFWDEFDYWNETSAYILRPFVLGIKSDKAILWIVLATNERAGDYEKNHYVYFLKFGGYTLKKLISYYLWRFTPQTVNEKLFFGRGAFSSQFREKKIAIVGLGALGSTLAETLARSGVSKLNLWDSDVVEPGNICRSTYDVRDLGESKVNALARKIHAINPICEVNDVKENGYWLTHSANYTEYIEGAFYNNINYDNQQRAIDRIKDHDLIIDCTGSNEILHFLSYAVPDSKIISLCITNHANELLCVTSRDGNPFELRKAYLSRIEQDTKNFYLEGSGCYSPTFLATNSDIVSLVNLAARDLNRNMGYEMLPHSTIWAHNRRGVIADRLETYKLEGYDIRMTISSETIYDGEDLEDTTDGKIGYLLGCYSKDGLLIMVTHIIDANNAETILNDAFKTSNGIIDYIGDFMYSGQEVGTYSKESLTILASKAADKSINTCNPLLAVRNPDRSMSYFLYINKELVPFKHEE